MPLIGSRAEKVFSNDPEIVGNLQSQIEGRIEIKPNEDGESYFDCIIDPIYDDRGKFIERVMIFRDITELEELKENKFLHSLLRHDVRNKAQIVQGYLELLKDYKLLEDAEDVVEKAKKGVREEIELIEKVRTLKEVEREEQTKEVKIETVLEEVIQELENNLNSQGFELKCDIVDAEVEAGPLVKELFSNILKNSIQHSDGDQIKIRTVEGDGKVTCTIEDDGRGIPDEDRNKIFERGFKSGDTGGSGLGMYLVKQIVGSYDGSIEVKDSDLGGARFDIHLQKT